MIATLVKDTPTKDGYYLVKFTDNSGLHLVLVQTMFDGKRVLVSDTCPFLSNLRCQNKTFKCITRGTELFYHEFPQNAWWSNGPVEIKLKESGA